MYSGLFGLADENEIIALMKQHDVTHDVTRSAVEPGGAGYRRRSRRRPRNRRQNHSHSSQLVPIRYLRRRRMSRGSAHPSRRHRSRDQRKMTSYDEASDYTADGSSGRLNRRRTLNHQP